MNDMPQKSAFFLL